MPIPKPTDGEKQDDFISRCMGNETMKNDYPDNDQRLAICFSSWRDKDKKSESMEIEKRAFDFQLDIEARGKEKPEIVGHAAVFNQYASIMWWQERVLPGAFSETIGKDDVRFLFNHNPDHILARTLNGTLQMSEDEKGLFIRAYPADTTLGRDLLKLIERGDISQMSFAFQIPKGGDEWIEGEDGQPDKRDIKRVKLYDTSAVTYPAYPTTDISARSYQEWRKEIESIQVVSPPIWRTNFLRKKLNLMKRRNIDD